MKNDPKLISLEIPFHWKINHHQWYEKDEYFAEDLLQAKYKDYLLDAGFYGENAEKGIYRMYVIKGDFLNGILIEKFVTSDLEKLKTKVNYFLDMFPKEILKLNEYPQIIDGLINGELL